MDIEVTYRNKTQKVPVSGTTTLKELKKTLAKTHKLPVEQIELSFQDQNDKGKVVLKEQDEPLTRSFNGKSLNLKNLGPQISWRTVFLVEYAGPLIIFPLLSWLSGLRGGKGLDSLQKTLFWMVIIHFVKREFETLFVHVFSRSTMPFKRVFINSTHYWVFCGLAIGVQLFFFWKNPNHNIITTYTLLGMWALSQFMNLMCHITTSAIRKAPGASSTTRGIPTGWGFDLVSSANYFWEILSWLTFALLSRTYTSYFFMALSLYQMVLWALDKHRKYKTEFDNYPKDRKAIIPFVL